MIKLTSDLDFKLTKKRFMMMGRRFSRTRMRLALSVLLPTLMITTFVFCTKADSNDYWFPEYRLLYNNTKPPLYKNISDQLIYSEVTGERTLFSGTAKSYDWQTDLVNREWVVKDGLLHETSAFDSTGNLSIKTFYANPDSDGSFAKIGSFKERLFFKSGDSLERRTLYNYTGPEEKFAKEGSYKELLTYGPHGSLQQRMAYFYPSPDSSQTKIFKVINGTEILTGESSSIRVDGTFKFTQHGYFENGDLQFHSTITSNSDSGEIESKKTEWDEAGNILRYEHKVNGEIVEEINNGKKDDTPDQ